MVAVAALFIHYLLTPTRRSRGQVMLLVYGELLRIRNRTIATHLFTATATTYTYYLYDLLTYILIRLLLRLPSYVYRSCCLYVYRYMSSYTYPLTSNPFTFIVYLLYSIYVYDLQGETRGTLFRLSCPFYIRIYIFIRTTYTSCCGPPG